jgi:hypothetical protein
MNRGQFAYAFCKGVGVEIERYDEAQLAVVCWIAAEGGYARFNPLNTTLWRPGCSNYNSVGVKNYASLDQGIEATVYTLNYGADRFRYGYRPIRRRIRKNRNAERILKAVEKSEWGTGGLALRVLADVRAGRQDFDHLRELPIVGT